jgi:hypothetical protein
MKNLFKNNLRSHLFFKSIAVILVICGLMACLSGASESKNSQQNDKNSSKIVEETIPLFAVTGFGSRLENISLNDLGKNACEGKVYVLESVQTKIEKMFQCPQKLKIIKNMSDFVAFAKENILITDLENLQIQYKTLKIDNINFFDNSDNYPLYSFGEKREKFDYKSKITKFTLTGVTAMTRFGGIAIREKSVKWLTEKVIDEFKTSDLTHISNEVSFKENCNFDTGIRFCSREEHFQALLDLGTDIIELTGNHNLDHGNQPYIKTYEWYQKQKMQIFGGGLTPEQAQKPLIITLKDGKKVAFVGFNEFCPLKECVDNQYKMGAVKYDSTLARKIIGNLRQNKEISYIFASVQFGEIDSYAPSRTQAKITRHLVDFGADFVYGSQAHQVQQVEFYNGKVIFHGLGNFLFDQIHRIGVRQGFFLHNYFYKGRVVQAVPVFTFTALERRPAIATAEETEQIKKVIYLDEKLYSK